MYCMPTLCQGLSKHFTVLVSVVLGAKHWSLDFLGCKNEDNTSHFCDE